MFQFFKRNKPKCIMFVLLVLMYCSHLISPTKAIYFFNKWDYPVDVKCTPCDVGSCSWFQVRPGDSEHFGRTIFHTYSVTVRRTSPPYVNDEEISGLEHNGYTHFYGPKSHTKKEKYCQILNQGCSAFAQCCDGLSCQPGVHKCYHEPRWEDEPCVAGYSCKDGLQCEAGSHVCRRYGGLGDPCHATRQCGAGFSCQPGVHKCYHEPRWEDEPCVAGHPCGPGLACRAGSHICKPTSDRSCHGDLEVGRTCNSDWWCRKGLSCHPSVHKCYNVPRHAGEPCDLSHSCKTGHRCDTMSLLCVAIPKDGSVDKPEIIGRLDDALVVLRDLKILWPASRQESMENIRLMSKALDKVAKGVGTSQIVTGATSTAAGLMIFAGFFLAPFTGGASLALTAGGTALGAASGVTSLAATLTELGINDEKINSAQASIRHDHCNTLRLEEAFREVEETITQINKTFHDNPNLELRIAQYTASALFKLTIGVPGAISTVNNGIQVLNLLSALKPDLWIRNGVMIEASFVKELSKIFAKEAAAPGTSILSKIVGFAGKLVGKDLSLTAGKLAVKTGGNVAKGLTVAGGSLSLAFGIWDVVSGAEKVKDGSDLAVKLREVVAEMEKHTAEVKERFDSMAKLDAVQSGGRLGNGEL